MIDLQAANRVGHRVTEELALIPWGRMATISFLMFVLFYVSMSAGRWHGAATYEATPIAQNLSDIKTDLTAIRVQFAYEEGYRDGLAEAQADDTPMTLMLPLRPLNVPSEALQGR